MGKRDSKMKYFGPLACLLVLVLGVVFFISMDETDPDPTSDGLAKKSAALDEVPPNAEDKQDEPENRPHESTPAPKVDESVPDARSEEIPDEEKKLERKEVRFQLVPTLDGKDAPWYRHQNPDIRAEFRFKDEEGDETNRWTQLNERGASAFFGSGRFPEKLYELKLYLIHGTYVENFGPNGEEKYVLTHAEVSEEGTTRLFKDLVAKDHVFDLGEIRIDIGFLLPDNLELFLMRFEHASKQALDHCNFDLEVSSDEVVLESYDTNFWVEPDASGFAYTHFDRHSYIRAEGAHELSRKDLESFQLRLLHDNATFTFQKRRGSAYDFGMATIGGAMVEVRHKVNLPKPFSWGEETEVGEDFLLIGPELGEEWVSGATSFKNGSQSTSLSDKAYAGDGVLLERGWLPAGYYKWSPRADILDSGSWSAQRKGSGVNLLDGESIVLEVSYHPDSDFTVLAFSQEGELVDGDDDFSLYGESLDVWESRDQTKPLDKLKSLKAFNGIYDDGEFGLTQYCFLEFGGTQSEYQHFFATKHYAPMVVAIPGGTSFVHVNFTKKWSEVVASEEKKRKTSNLLVKIDFNGIKVPEGHEFSVLVSDEHRYDYESIIVENGRAERTFERYEGQEMTLYLSTNVSALLGFENDKIAEPLVIKADDKATEVTIKLIKPNYTVLDDSDFHMRLECGDTPLASADGDIPVEGRTYKGEERTEISYGTYVQRLSLNDFIVSYPIAGELKLGSKIFERFSSVSIESGSWKFSTSKAGTYTLPADDFDGWHYGPPVDLKDKNWVIGHIRGSKKKVSIAYSGFPEPSDGEADAGRGRPDGDELPRITIDYAPTIVTFAGQRAGYSWMLRSTEIKWESQYLQPGTSLAFKPGEYRWVAFDDWQEIPIEQSITILATESFRITIPGNELLSKKGEVRFRLTPKDRDFLVQGEIVAGIAYKLLGRASLGDKTSSSDKRRDNAIYPIRIIDNELVVSSLPTGKNFYLQLFGKHEENKYYMAPPVSLKLDKEPKRLALPKLIESWGYSNFPWFDTSVSEFDGRSPPPYDKLLVVEFYVNGKRIAPEIGLERNKEHECWIWSAKKPTGAPLLKLRCTPSPTILIWEEGAIDRIKPVVDLLRAESGE